VEISETLNNSLLDVSRQGDGAFRQGHDNFLKELGSKLRFLSPSQDLLLSPTCHSCVFLFSFFFLFIYSYVHTLFGPFRPATPAPFLFLIKINFQISVEK
jgi:hypothetical protein